MRYAFVYMVSNKSYTLHCGMTTDLRARFEEHKNRTYENGFTGGISSIGWSGLNVCRT